MRIWKITLLDRAKADLDAARNSMLVNPNSALVVDIVAHQCAQCFEKVVKYTQSLEGAIPSIGHHPREYLPGLKNVEMRAIVEASLFLLDEWTAAMLYSEDTTSKILSVQKALDDCDRMIELAENAMVRATAEYAFEGVESRMYLVKLLQMNGHVKHAHADYATWIVDSIPKEERHLYPANKFVAAIQYFDTWHRAQNKPVPVPN
jgi:HEPN domain-containing protein